VRTYVYSPSLARVHRKHRLSHHFNLPTLVETSRVAALDILGQRQRIVWPRPLDDEL